MADYVNIKVPTGLADLVDQIVEKRLRGYRNRGEFVIVAIREKLKEFEEELNFQPRFAPFHIDDDHVTIMDNQLNTLVGVYFRSDKASCDYCGEHNCEHINFALSIPKVQKALRERGWIIEDGKIVRGPP